MGATYELSATVREKVGKGAARAVRRQGMIPAVIYGGNKPPIAISLPGQELFLKIHGGGFYTTLATIAVDGEKIQAIPRDYQLDPVSDRPVHVDFLRVVAGFDDHRRRAGAVHQREPGARHQPRRRAQRRAPPRLG